jgi:hypothetical protein
MLKSGTCKPMSNSSDRYDYYRDITRKNDPGRFWFYFIINLTFGIIGILMGLIVFAEAV